MGNVLGDFWLFKGKRICGWVVLCIKIFKDFELDFLSIGYVQIIILQLQYLFFSVSGILKSAIAPAKEKSTPQNTNWAIKLD